MSHIFVTGAVQHCPSKSLPRFRLLPPFPLLKVKVDNHLNEDIGDENFDGFNSGDTGLEPSQCLEEALWGPTHWPGIPA